jgi:hypothetical protein
MPLRLVLAPTPVAPILQSSDTLPDKTHSAEKEAIMILSLIDTERTKKRKEDR